MGRVDLKMGWEGGGVILVPQKIPNKTSNFDPMSQKYSANAFQNGHKIHFLLHFHVCFSNN